ncbi:MAG: 3-mercaptopyruvate sulfurtransferase [Alphaproteobacteria bacterium]
MATALISAKDLKHALEGDTAPKLIDCSWTMPSSGADPRNGFAKAHIEGAIFLHIDEVADRFRPLPHMMPPPAQFAEQLGALGIRETDDLVIYDQTGLFLAASRGWWMFRAMGHRGKVQVLDGGLKAWQAAGYPVASGPAEQPTPASYKATPRTEIMRDAGDVARVVQTGSEQVVDVRDRARWLGEAEEVWEGRASGRIPGSLNLPFTDLIDMESGTLHLPETLRAHFASAGVDLDKPVVFSCGSGVTACVAALALHRLGVEDAAVYDGSWAEWGLGGWPVAKGKPKSGERVGNG